MAHGFPEASIALAKEALQNRFQLGLAAKWDVAFWGEGKGYSKARDRAWSKVWR